MSQRMPKPTVITERVSVEVPVLIFPEPKAGGYSAEVPALPGCYAQGETLAEVKANLQEAIDGWLAVAHEEAATAQKTKAAGA